jgi:hypothetical protein
LVLCASIEYQHRVLNQKAPDRLITQVTL